MSDCNLGVVDRNNIKTGDFVRTIGGRDRMMTGGLRGIVTGVHLEPYTRKAWATIEPENMERNNRGDFETIVWPCTDLIAITGEPSLAMFNARLKAIEQKLGIVVS